MSCQLLVKMKVFYLQLVLCVINYLTTRLVNCANIRRQKLNMRCTRRFSPGTCAEAVVPVWTFDFFALNCTERLGCYLSTRSNRFNTYMYCLRSCRAFIDLYTQTLSEDDGQLKRLRSESRESIRRADGFHQLFYQTEDVYEDDQSEVWEGPASEGAERDDVIDVSDMLVPDIDYAGAQVSNEDCDLVHHMQTSKYN